MQLLELGLGTLATCNLAVLVSLYALRVVFYWKIKEGRILGLLKVERKSLNMPVIISFKST